MTKKEKKALKAQVEAFKKERGSYKTREEKRAWSIALKERKKAWLKSLEAMDARSQADARAQAKRFWRAVYKKELLIGAAVLAVLLIAAAVAVILL